VTDRRSLSRRKLLWAMTTVGAAASAGGGTAALLNDSESLGESTVTAGVVDLETEPSWGNDDSLGTISKGESGSRTVEITVTENPSYVWFRTDCKQCLAVEDVLYVRYGIDTDGDGDVDIPITDGYITLGEARERYGTGYHLGTLDSSKTWTLVAEWELRERVESTDVSLSFDFYAAQMRHSDPDSIRLPWSCESCDGSSVGSPLSGPDINWIAFCGDPDFGPDFTPEVSGERTLLLDTGAYTISSDVDTIAIKYGRKLEVFSYSGQSSLTVGQGDGDVFEQTGGNNYDGTTRTNSGFCDGTFGCKFDADRWECTDDTNGQGGGQGGGNDEPVGPPNRLVPDALGGEL